MPLIRLFLTTFRLSAAEQEKLRKRKSMGGQIKIRYTKRRIAMEKDFPSVEAAIEWAESQRVKNRYEPDVYDEYTRVFAAEEARNGERCERLEDAFHAEEVELFDANTLEALTAK